MKLLLKNLTFVVAVCLIFSEIAFGQDLLLNGGFENWTDNLPDNWTHVESVSKENPKGGVVHNGSALRHTGVTGTVDLGQLITGITPGANYSLTIWYTYLSSVETHASIWCYWKNGETFLDDNENELRGPNSGYLDYIDYYGEDFHAWKEYTVEVTAPALANSFYFEVQTHVDAEVCYDDFSFVLTDTPTPITLADFTAKANNGVIELAWETATETNNARFVIYRNDEAIASVAGAGTTSEPHAYTYTDATVVPGVAYTYVLADIDYANVETKYEENAVTITIANDLVEADFVVGAAYPNPFNPTAVVPVKLSRDAMVKASLYDLNGREIKALVNASFTAGTHELRIDGSGLTTGMYLVQVVVENVVDVQKIALMK